MPQNLGRVADRSIRRHGEAATVTTYADDGTRDDQGDPGVTETTTTTTAIFALPLTPNDQQTPAGVEGDIDAKVWLQSDVSVDDAESDAIRPSTVTRDDTGRTYRVLVAWAEPTGVTRGYCAEV